MDTLIINYLNGTVSQTEKEELLKWLREDDSHRADFVRTRDLWLASGATFLSEKEKRNAFLLFTKRVKQYEGVPRMGNFSYALRVAATVAILVICTVGSFFLGRTTQNKNPLKETIVMNQALMGNESKGSVTLPDGTIVWLNAGSRLIYPEEFSLDTRQVTLEGEGYFEVMRNEKVPFYVKTDQMTVQVLGTTFDVKSYRDKEITQTVLLSGKVAIQLKGQSDKIQLMPNQKITYNRSTGLSSVEEVDASEYAIWIKDKLIFHNEPLGDILRKMERWYGINIRCSKQVPQQLNLSLTIRKETKEEIFRLLTFIAPVDYTMSGDDVLISAR